MRDTLPALFLFNETPDRRTGTNENHHFAKCAEHADYQMEVAARKGYRPCAFNEEINKVSGNESSGLSRVITGRRLRLLICWMGFGRGRFNNRLSVYLGRVVIGKYGSDYCKANIGLKDI